MTKFAIISDSGSDLTADLRERFGIHDIMHGIIYPPEGEAFLVDMDWERMSPQEYYDSMKSKKALYRSGCPTIGETQEIFEKNLSAGIDVLCISMSSGLSCTYQNCVTVGKEMAEKYPDRKIICIDSLRYSTSLALLLMLASQKRDEGATIEETAEYVEQIKHCVHQMGPMDDLFFLVKTGRISNFKAFFGTLVGVNPMADFNSKGMAEVLAKFKGKSAAYDATIKYMKKTITNPEDQTIFIAHSNRESGAKILADMIKEAFNPKEIVISSVGMACGSGIGPGLCAAFYVGTPISQDSSLEKAIMAEIVGGDTMEKTNAPIEERNASASNQPFVLLADSTCDLDNELRQRFNIDYVKMNYVLDGKEYPASLDWEFHSVKEFYDLMRNGKRITTTQVSQESYRVAFEEALSAGKDVVYISCSSALSGSINIATLVARDLAEKYPNNKIYCVDSLNSSFGQGIMLIKASELRAEGKSAEEVADYINGIKLNINQHGTVASLEYLRRAGRVKASKAFFGNLFGVKPILISDRLGQNYAVKKAKGRLNSCIEVANMVAECTEGIERDFLYISHADCIEDAQMLRDEILKVSPFKNVHIGPIGPIVGASVGPGTVAVYCNGKEVTIEGKE